MTKDEVIPFYSERLLGRAADPNGGVSRWKIVCKDGSVSEHQNNVCHAGMRFTLKDIEIFSSNFDVHPGDELLGEKYWNWMTGSTSPYHCLFENGEAEKIFGRDGLQTGFFLNPVDVNHEKKNTLLYNFCIAMRMIHEYPEKIRNWSTLVDLGLHPVEALYLGKILDIHKEGDTCSVVDANDGCHWPLWFRGSSADFNYSTSKYECTYRYIDFDLLKEGRPRFEGTSCDQWCLDPVSDNLDDYRTKVKEKTVVKGRFSSRKGLPLPEVISEFKTWVQGHQEGLKKLGVKKHA